MLCFSREEWKFHCFIGERTSGKGKRKKGKEYEKMHPAFCKNLVHFYKTKVFPVVHLVIYRRNFKKFKSICYVSFISTG